MIERLLPKQKLSLFVNKFGKSEQWKNIARFYIYIKACQN